MLCSSCFQTISKTKSDWMARWCHSCTPCCLRQVLNPRVSAAMEMAISGETLRPVVFFVALAESEGNWAAETSQAGLTLSDTRRKSPKRERCTTQPCNVDMYFDLVA